MPEKELFPFAHRGCPLQLLFFFPSRGLLPVRTIRNVTYTASGGTMQLCLFISIQGMETCLIHTFNLWLVNRSFQTLGNFAIVSVLYTRKKKIVLVGK